MKFIQAAFVVLAVLCLPTGVMASGDHGTVINLSGKQRMLTQKMSKEVLLVALDVNKDENLTNLRATRDLFDKTLVGLRDGDEELGLPHTKKPKILKALKKVEDLWEEFDVAYLKLLLPIM